MSFDAKAEQIGSQMRAQEGDSFKHLSVMLTETVDMLDIREGGVYVLDAGRLDDAQRALLTALAVNRSEPARPEEAFASLPALPMERTLPPAARLADNGYGGFADDGYQIDVLPNRDTPRPWANPRFQS